jgi:glycerol-3-phosphate dehydrogenase
MYDVAIIGAGIIGSLIARELSRYELSIALIEKENDVSMGSTKANSGIVHGGYAESSETLKGRLCCQGRMKFARLDRELNFGFRETGSLLLSFDEDMEGLENLYRNGIRNGVHELEIISGERAREIEPNISSTVKRALYCRGAGVCSPYEMAIACAENAVANSVELFLFNEVIRIERKNNSFDIHTIERSIVNECVGRSRACESERTFSAHYIINASGVNADIVSALAGDSSFAIYPRPGEYLLFARGSGDAFKTVIFQLPTKFGKGVLVTPTYHGNLMLGPDARDTDERTDTSTHIERLREIVGKSKAVIDRIDFSKFIRSFTGIRAVSSTHDFIIGESDVQGFINVAGIQSPGLTASPAIAAMMYDILQKAGCRLVPKKSFNPERRAIITRKDLLPFNEIKSLIDIPPSPERIVCRCEQVRESEIVDAISRNIPVRTADAVKRRTRAGMGWCQGSFCRPRVKEIIERETGEQIPEGEDVAHSGVNRITRSEIIKDFGMKA